MINILKENKNKEKMEDYFEQLDVIDEIRREIVQSSNGVLFYAQFKDIMQQIRKVYRKPFLTHILYIFNTIEIVLYLVV